MKVRVRMKDAGNMWPDSELAGKVLIPSKNFQLGVTKCSSDKTEPTPKLLLT